MILLLLMPMLTLQGFEPPVRKGDPSPVHFWHEVTSVATPQEIWDIWTDVPQWHTWDSGLKAARADSLLSLGVQGTITSLEGRESAFEIVEWQPLRSYTFRTKLPLGGLYVRRSLEETPDGVRFTHEVWFQGFSKGLFGRILGPGFREMLPDVMAEVARQAEGR